MTADKFKSFCEEFLTELKAIAPYDTGNLSKNAIRIEWISEDECNIYVDQDIAPYMVFTNEHWISPKWRGKQNPNEDWWNYGVMLIASELAGKYQGKFDKATGDEFNGIIN
jgi:hypothetical protein